MEKKKKNDLKIISKAIKNLSLLDDQERKIHRAQKSEIETIQNVMDRFCDDRDLQERLAKDQEAIKLLQEAKEAIATLRKLLHC